MWIHVDISRQYTCGTGIQTKQRLWTDGGDKQPTGYTRACARAYICLHTHTYIYHIVCNLYKKLYIYIYIYIILFVKVNTWKKCQPCAGNNTHFDCQQLFSKQLDRNFYEVENNTPLVGLEYNRELEYTNIYLNIIYRQVSNIRRTLVRNWIDDHSDVVGASPIGAAPTTSSFSPQHLASIYCANTTTSRDEKHLSIGIWCVLYYRFYGSIYIYLLILNKIKNLKGFCVLSVNKMLLIRC